MDVTQVDPCAVPLAKSGGHAVDPVDSHIPGEMVQSARRHENQRQMLLGRHRGDSGHGSVATGHAQRLGPGRSLLDGFVQLFDQVVAGMQDGGFRPVRGDFLGWVHAVRA
jgi:hypothetical protein